MRLRRDLDSGGRRAADAPDDRAAAPQKAAERVGRRALLREPLAA